MSSIDVGAPTILKAEGISKAWASEPQFEDISLTVGKGARMGLIGVNGAGKTTMMRCLAGLDDADSGVVESASACNIVYVDQEPDWPDSLPAYAALFADAGNTNNALSESARAVRRYMEIISPEAESEENYLDRLSAATDAMEQSDAWVYMENGLSMAKRLNVGDNSAIGDSSMSTNMLYRRVSTMSGGERKRLGLAAALLRNPDVLLLDEPTNHLDADALEWLGDFLGTSTEGGVGAQAADKNMAVLLVTHDRYFLEKVCNEIVELDRASIHRYPGNYNKYLELKNDRLKAEDADKERAKTRLKKEKEWMSRQPKARQAKSKARQDQFYELVAKAQDKSKGSLTDDGGRVQLMTKDEEAEQRRLGGVVIDVNDAKFILNGPEGKPSAGRLLLDHFSYSFRQRDRIAIVGPNGVGKSTFLKLLTGNLPLLAGTIKVGDTVRIGYYEQTGLNLTPQEAKEPVLRFVQAAVEKGVSRNINTLGDDVSNSGYDGGAGNTLTGVTNNKDTGKMVITQGAPVGRRKAMAGKEGGISIDVVSDQYSGGGSSTALSEREAMKLLTRFNFDSKRWYDRVDKLSGGERRRLQLLQVLATNPNVLLLDEPSNDLDLQTLQTLEDYLVETFQGMLVIVSHDNFLVNKVADHLFVFEGDGVVRDFQGSYTDYLNVRKSNRVMKGGSGAVEDTTRATGEDPKGSGNAAASKANGKSRSKLTFPEQKEMQKLESAIAKLSAAIAEKEEEVGSEMSIKKGYSHQATLQEEADKMKVEVEEKELRWLELAEKDA